MSQNAEIDPCPFCNVLDGVGCSGSPTEDPFDVSRRILFSSGTVYACAGLSPIVFPYILVVSVRHLRSFAMCGSEERRDTIRSLHALLNSGLFPSGRLTVFEHGDLVRHPNSQCLEHFHLHVIDGGVEIVPAFLRARPDAVKVSLSEAMPLELTENYFLAATCEKGGNLEAYVASNPFCGRQYFRRMLAFLAESSDWDWRVATNQIMVQRLLDIWKENESPRTKAF